MRNCQSSVTAPRKEDGDPIVDVRGLIAAVILVKEDLYNDMHK